MSNKDQEKVEKVFMELFDTVPAVYEDGYLEVETRRLDKTQLKALIELDLENLNLSVKGSRIVITIN